MFTAFMGDKLPKQEQECVLLELERLSAEYRNEQMRIATNGAFEPTPTPTEAGLGVSREAVLDAFAYEADSPGDDTVQGCRPRTVDVSEDWAFRYDLIGQPSNVRYVSVDYRFCGLLNPKQTFDEERVLAGYKTLLDLFNQLPPSVLTAVADYVTEYGPNLCSENADLKQPDTLLILDHGVDVMCRVSYGDDATHLAVGLAGALQ